MLAQYYMNAYGCDNILCMNAMKVSQNKFTKQRGHSIKRFWEGLVTPLTSTQHRFCSYTNPFQIQINPNNNLPNRAMFSAFIYV